MESGIYGDCEDHRPEREGRNIGWFLVDVSVGDDVFSARLSWKRSILEFFDEIWSDLGGDRQIWFVVAGFGFGSSERFRRRAVLGDWLVFRWQENKPGVFLPFFGEDGRRNSDGVDWLDAFCRPMMAGNGWTADFRWNSAGDVDGKKWGRKEEKFFRCVPRWCLSAVFFPLMVLTMVVGVFRQYVTEKNYSTIHFSPLLIYFYSTIFYLIFTLCWCVYGDCLWVWISVLMNYNSAYFSFYCFSFCFNFEP